MYLLYWTIFALAVPGWFIAVAIVLRNMQLQARRLRRESIRRIRRYSF